MLDVILNGKLSAAADAGIAVELVRTQAPDKLPLTNAELCSLMLNLLDNAVEAASAPGVKRRYTWNSRITIQVHTPDQQLHLHGILAPPCRKGAPLHESKERDLYNWRSTGSCDYINWRSHHAKLSGDLETG